MRGNVDPRLRLGAEALPGDVHDRPVGESDEDESPLRAVNLDANHPKKSVELGQPVRDFIGLDLVGSLPSAGAEGMLSRPTRELDTGCESHRRLSHCFHVGCRGVLSFLYAASVHGLSHEYLSSDRR